MSECPIQAVIENVCRIPADFTERRDISVVDLLAESGYLEVGQAVTENIIEKHLRAHPDLIHLWAATQTISVACQKPIF
jgi:hypothetical protein